MTIQYFTTIQIIHRHLSQLAVMLYFLGHYGNGASLEDVMQTAGILEGSMENYTNHCIDAIEPPLSG
jgi:hypothetical protein